MEFSHETGKLRRRGIGMKFSDYLNVEPSPKKVTQSFNIRDENRENILEQKLAQASNELQSLKDQTAEVISLRQTTFNLNKERSELSTELANTRAELEERKNQLDDEAKLKESIRSLESQTMNSICKKSLKRLL